MAIYFGFCENWFLKYFVYLFPDDSSKVPAHFHAPTGHARTFQVSDGSVHVTNGSDLEIINRFVIHNMFGLLPLWLMLCVDRVLWGSQGHTVVVEYWG